MKYLIDHDYHIHSMLSLCSGHPEQTPENILELSEMAESVLSRRFDSDKLIILHTKRAKFTFEKPVAWTRDGEAGGEHQEIELRNYKAPVRVIF